MYTSDKAKVMMIKLTILAITGLAIFGITTAHADHVDNHIWIETADGKFVLNSELTFGEYGLNSDGYYYNDNKCATADLIGNTGIAKPQKTIINEHYVLDQRKGECGNRAIEEEYHNTSSLNRRVDSKTHHECVVECSKIQYFSILLA